VRRDERIGGQREWGRLRERRREGCNAMAYKCSLLEMSDSLVG
jgi:hypothetical protein